MKTKNFILVFIVIIMAMILTFTLQCLFSEIAGDFGLSCGMLFLSIFFLFGYKNALMPMERGGFAINMTKRYYQSRDELPKYQKLCKILFIVTISFGTLSFVKGMGNVLFHYVKLFLAQYIASLPAQLENLFFGRFSQLITAKGYVYPLTENHGSILKKLVVRIDFERVCQEKSHSRKRMAFFS